MDAVASRLASGTTASFSGRSQTLSFPCGHKKRAPQQSVSSRAYQTRLPGAHAIAIAWDESFAESEWNVDYAEEQAAPTPPRREFAIQQRAPKPLKINRDLLLVRDSKTRACGTKMPNSGRDVHTHRCTSSAMIEQGTVYMAPTMNVCCCSIELGWLGRRLSGQARQANAQRISVGLRACCGSAWQWTPRTDAHM